MLFAAAVRPLRCSHADRDARDGRRDSSPRSAHQPQVSSAAEQSPEVCFLRSACVFAQEGCGRRARWEVRARATSGRASSLPSYARRAQVLSSSVAGHRPAPAKYYLTGSALSVCAPVRFDFRLSCHKPHIPLLVSVNCARSAVACAVLLRQVVGVTPDPVGAAVRALLMALEPPRLRISRDLGAWEARMDAPASGGGEGRRRRHRASPQAACAASRVDLVAYLICACGWCVGAACTCLVRTTACALCVSQPLGVPGRAADGASRGPGSKRATLAASLTHTSLTVPSDRALSAAVGTSRRHLRPTSCGGAMPLVVYDHAGAAGADAAASALAEEASER